MVDIRNHFLSGFGIFDPIYLATDKPALAEDLPMYKPALAVDLPMD